MHNSRFNLNWLSGTRYKQVILRLTLNKPALMQIGELAELTGLSRSKIRFYEDAGLITPAKRSPSGYRLYDERAELILNLILRGQQAGFGLKDIKTLLPDEQGKWQKTSLIEALKQKISDIDTMQQTLSANRQRLELALRNIENQPENADCIDNTRQVIRQAIE